MTKISSSFDLRRMDSLSNTIFGVAMTLLAYDVPKAAVLSQQITIQSLIIVYGARVEAIVLSFAVAGAFWISQHRRLAIAPEVSQAVVFFHLLFLLFIILLPLTTGLYGAYSELDIIVRIYTLHLTLIAMINALLWYWAAKGQWKRLAAPFFPLIIFFLASLVTMVSPSVSRPMLYLAFLAPLFSVMYRKSS